MSSTEASDSTVARAPATAERLTGDKRKREEFEKEHKDREKDDAVSEKPSKAGQAVAGQIQVDVVVVVALPVSKRAPPLLFSKADF